MKKKSSRDFSRPILLIAMVALIALALLMNFYKSNNSVSKILGTIDIDNGDEKIDWKRYQTTEIELSESLNIEKAGTYHLTGTLNGSISIKVTKEEPVKLILDNTTIKSPSGPAITCLEADDLVIELVGKNYLEDSSEYPSDLDIDIKGAIYSKADLTFEGDGILTLVANKEDGIVGKDDLKFKSGTYTINAVDDGIRGKDSVYILDGVFSIDSKADAIKSTEEFTVGKGFVLIEGGSFNIKAGAKGIKAISSILIYSGHFNIKSFDDSIHSNNYVGIVNGDYKIESNDDAVHADRELIIDDGKIEITKSYEGLEAQVVTINGGDISVITSDDGINAGGGADLSSMNRPGANTFKTDEQARLTINGGNVYVNANGDGLDSNGYIYFNGGRVIVDGPTNNGNGALDSGISIVMNGGEVIAVGSSGMAANLGEKSSVYNISVYFESIQDAGTNLKIKDSSGRMIIEHTSAKTFNHITAGSEKFIPGEIYNIYIDDKEYATFTISNTVTTIGGHGVNMGPEMEQPPDQRR